MITPKQERLHFHRVIDFRGAVLGPASGPIRGEDKVWREMGFDDLRATLLVLCRRIACAVICCAMHAESPAKELPTKPNILHVVVDDLGWSDVGWHDGFSRTPTLDRLVREGVDLDQHYVQPVCTPTRAALLSGRYPGRFGPHALVPSNLRAMPIGTPTLASMLRSLGYATYQAGKWHLGSRPEWGPTAFGFEHGYGTLAGAADPWTHRYRRGSPYVDTWHRDGRPLREEGNATELVAAEVVRRIEERRVPWFIYVPFHAVHTPVDAPEPYKRLYDGIRFHGDDAKHESRLRLAAMVSQVDAKVAEFLAAIERTGQASNTLIILHSDNGGIESLQNAYDGDVGPSPLNSENRPLRGQKNTLYEGGTRVCALVHWPGLLRPRKHRGAMHCVDWLPTIAQIVGFRPATDPEWDGVSQWRSLQGHEAPDPHRVIYIATADGHSVRQGDWKLIVPGKAAPQLFDIATDPRETADLAAAQPARVAILRELLDAERAKDAADMPEDLRGLPK